MYEGYALIMNVTQSILLMAMAKRIVEREEKGVIVAESFNLHPFYRLEDEY